jgi:hypothetical protein
MTVEKSFAAIALLWTHASNVTKCCNHAHAVRVTTIKPENLQAMKRKVAATAPTLFVMTASA